MRDWKKIFEDMTEEEKINLSILRVMECTNGVIQYAYRDQHPDALSLEETRKAMKFSMGCIKRMEIPLGDSSIKFEGEIAEIFAEIRELYNSGAKNGNNEDFEKFIEISITMYNVLGKDRILRAQEILGEHIVEIAPDKLQYGVDYILQFIK